MEWKNIYQSGKYEYRTFDHSRWLKIMYQDVSTQVGFANYEEALSCDKPYKYSIIGEISNNSRLRDRKFEFILEYPLLGKYNRWKQRHNPIYENEETGKEKVDGYKPIHIGAPRDSWGGLTRICGNGAYLGLLNGSPKIVGVTDHWYTIGSYQGFRWGSQVQNVDLPANDIGTNIVYLWMRFSDDPTSKVTPHSIFVYWFILLYR